MRILLLFLVIAAVASQIIPEEYSIDLDQPPEYRYANLVQDKKAHIIAFLDRLNKEDLYTAAFAFANYIRRNLTALVDTEFLRECQGIANVIGRTAYELVVFNYMYELGAFRDFCTSVIAVNQKGEPVLGRNLDYGFQQYLANSSVTLVYYKNKKELFRTAGHAGLIGTHTVMRKGGYSLTLNERTDGGLRTTLSTMLGGCQEVPWLMRKTAEECSTVECAVSRLSHGTVCAPVYFIVAAESVQLVIERAREAVAHTYSILNFPNSFMVQTNTDRLLPDSDGRRTTAELRLSQLPSINEEAIRSVLVQPPNFNSLTLMTVVMNPVRGTFNSTVWLASQ